MGRYILVAARLALLCHMQFQKLWLLSRSLSEGYEILYLNLACSRRQHVKYLGRCRHLFILQLQSPSIYPTFTSYSKTPLRF